VVREVLRLLEQHERLRALHLEKLSQAIERGVDSGPAVDDEKAFARLRARCESMVASDDG
jgi:Arc/MetJ-type ribon-helix-helix transcriptional regulator